MIYRTYKLCECIVYLLCGILFVLIALLTVGGALVV